MLPLLAPNLSYPQNRNKLQLKKEDILSSFLHSNNTHPKSQIQYLNADFNETLKTLSCSSHGVLCFKNTHWITLHPKKVIKKRSNTDVAIFHMLLSTRIKQYHHMLHICQSYQKNGFVKLLFL
ncbi:hypothetical protein HanPSC8_Chr13g0593341 [Helianthus annuus]|nr:hypothetical protein HanPSC8_Chr13g0593341 [Helianthus annuus]